MQASNSLNLAIDCYQCIVSPGYIELVITKILLYFADLHGLELKKAHKQAVKEEKREKRKNKVPKHVKKRKEKMAHHRRGGH